MSVIPENISRSGKAGTPVVSIAMPVHNGGNLLELAVQSLLNQSFKDWELILIDDGSTDSAIENLACIDDSRIRIIRDGNNLGLATRLNQAIDIAKGRYIARMDHDDLSHPERLSRQVSYLEDNPDVDLVGANCIKINNEGKIVGEMPYVVEHAEICQKPWKGFYLYHPTWLGKASWFKAHRYAEPGPFCSEDQELLLRSYLKSKYYVLPKYLLAYRVRSSTPFTKLWRTRKTLFKLQANYFVLRGSYTYLFLAFLTTIMRVGIDIARKAASVLQEQNNRTSFKSLSDGERQSWEKIITGLYEPLQNGKPDSGSTDASADSRNISY